MEKRTCHMPGSKTQKNVEGKVRTVRTVEAVPCHDYWNPAKENATSIHHPNTLMCSAGPDGTVLYCNVHYCNVQYCNARYYAMLLYYAMLCYVILNMLYYLSILYCTRIQ